MFLLHDIQNTLWIRFLGFGITLNYGKFAVQNFITVEMYGVRWRERASSVQCSSFKWSNAFYLHMNRIISRWLWQRLVRDVRSVLESLATKNGVQFSVCIEIEKLGDNVHIIFTSCRHIMHTERFTLTPIGRNEFRFRDDLIFFPSILSHSDTHSLSLSLHLCIFLSPSLSLTLSASYWQKNPL